MIHRWRAVGLVMAVGILLLTLTVDVAFSKSLANQRRSAELEPPQERVDDDIASEAERLQAVNDLIQGPNHGPGGPWGLGLDFSWLFACPECDFISKIGMKNAQHTQNEL